MLKRSIALLLSVICLLISTSCNKKGVAVDSESPLTVPKDSYEIVWYYISPKSQMDIELIQQKVNEYLKDKLNVTVKLNPLDWGPYKIKLQNIMASGEKYDIRFINSSDYTTDVFKGAYLQIDDLLDKYAPKTKAVLGEDFINGARVNGKLYALQANKDKAHYYAITYRKDIAAKYGIDVSTVKSFEDLFPIFDIIKKNEPNMYTFGMGLGTTPTLLGPFNDLGSVATILSSGPDAGKIVNKFATKEYMDCVKLSHKMYEAGYLFKDAAALDNVLQLKSEGKVFAVLEQYKVGKLDEINAAAGSTGYVYGEIPLTKPIMNSKDTMGSMMAISHTSKNPARVMRFLEIVNTDKYLNNLLNFGVEGVHYSKTGDNRIKPINNTGYDMVGMQWMFGNIFENYLVEGEDENKFELLDKFNKSAEVSPYLGFVPDFESVEVEVAACNNVITEFQKLIEFGADDPEVSVPKFLAKLEAAGSNRIIEVVQKQYDEWGKHKNKSN